MKFTRAQIIFIAIGGIIALILLLILFGVIPGLRTSQGPITQIEMWGTDSPRTWAGPIAAFEGSREGVDIVYKTIDAEDYESQLINALAAGQGPDIFMFENNWLLKHGDKVTPVNPEQISAVTVDTLFPRVVTQDFVSNSRVYALPLYIDTLAMVYNQDLFDQGDIVFPPTTWQEVADVAQNLRVINAGELTRAAAAIGGSSKTISNAGDLSSVMMMQNGASMVDSRLNNALFASSEGRAAFDTYLGFANPSSVRYSWDETGRLDQEAFAREEAAAIFAYYSETKDLKARNAFMPIRVAPLPQFDTNNAVNIADYWGLTVSTSAEAPAVAWDFIIFATTNGNVAESYSQLTQRPPALKLLINEYLTNPEFGVFTSQALTARSWLQVGEEVMQEAMNEAISAVLSEELKSSNALSRADSRVTESLRSR